MKKQITESKIALARNITFLMGQKGMKYSDIDKMPHKPIAGRYLRQVVKGERVPTIDMIDAIGTLFGFTGLQMLGSTLVEEYFEDNQVAEVVANYLASTKEGKKHIQQTAEFSPKEDK